MLNTEGFRKFCREYEKWMIGNNDDNVSGFRRLIRGQAALLKQSIQKGTEYAPFSLEARNVCGEL